MDLFDSLKIRDITLRNRIVVFRMCQYSSVDGFATDWHLVHLGSRAVGGAAIVFTEASAVTPEGRISRRILASGKMNRSSRSRGLRVLFVSKELSPECNSRTPDEREAQSAPGKGSARLGKEAGVPVASSAAAFDANYPKPAALDATGIHRIVNAFRDAAVRALKAGFQVLELHAAHGYLIDEFLSPVSNKRTDNYGGTIDNRIRFLAETVSAVREVWPATFPLFVRISATDWIEGGWDVDQSIYAVEENSSNGC